MHAITTRPAFLDCIGECKAVALTGRWRRNPYDVLMLEIVRHGRQRPEWMAADFLLATDERGNPVSPTSWAIAH